MMKKFWSFFNVYQKKNTLNADDSFLFNEDKAKWGVSLKDMEDVDRFWLNLVAEGNLNKATDMMEKGYVLSSKAQTMIDREALYLIHTLFCNSEKDLPIYMERYDYLYVKDDYSGLKVSANKAYDYLEWGLRKELFSKDLLEGLTRECPLFTNRVKSVLKKEASETVLSMDDDRALEPKYISFGISQKNINFFKRMSFRSNRIYLSSFKSNRSFFILPFLETTFDTKEMWKAWGIFDGKKENLASSGVFNEALFGKVDKDSSLLKKVESISHPIFNISLKEVNSDLIENSKNKKIWSAIFFKGIDSSLKNDLIEGFFFKTLYQQHRKNINPVEIFKQAINARPAFHYLAAFVFIYDYEEVKMHVKREDIEKMLKLNFNKNFVKGLEELRDSLIDTQINSILTANNNVLINNIVDKMDIKGLLQLMSPSEIVKINANLVSDKIDIKDSITASEEVKSLINNYKKSVFEILHDYMEVMNIDVDKNIQKTVVEQLQIISKEIDVIIVNYTNSQLNAVADESKIAKIRVK